MLTRRHLLAAGAAAMAKPAAAASDGVVVLRDGLVHEGGPGAAKVQSVLIEDGRIRAIGPFARLSTSGARIVDLKGASVFPGFTDSHAHLQGIGLRELTLNLEGTGSVADLISRLKAWADAHPGPDPISGRGWIETHWPEKRFPTAADLDKAVPNRPVVLTRADGHALVANTAALRLGGVLSGAQAPAGGQILRDGSGAPTGMLIDNAMGPVTARMPGPSDALKREALARGAALYAQRGWTGLHNMSVSGEDWRNLSVMARTGLLPVRVDNYLNAADARSILADGPVQIDDRLAARGIKIYMDGALGSRGAALLQPYADAEGLGLLTTPPDQVEALMIWARDHRVQVAIHAIGDRGNRIALDLMQAAWKANSAGLAAARWRIEHAQILDPADIPRFGKLGIIASMQPSHAIGDLYFAPARLGAKRLAGAYAWKRLLQTRAVIAGGSDAPVEKGDPMVEFYAATYRHDLAGKAGPDWGLDQAVSRARALAMFTTGAAHAVWRERDLGLLAPGRAADLSIFDTNLMKADVAAIPKARALMTVVGGRVVHNAL